MDDKEKVNLEDEQITEEGTDNVTEEASQDYTETEKEDIVKEAVDESEQEEPEEEEKKFFGKNKKKDKKEDSYKQKIDELEDKVKRQMAEFENFRKRTDKEKAVMFETGAKSVIEKMLPVVDNFERGLASISEEDKDSAFANGMNMIYKQLISELDKLGVKPIETVGEEFNPDIHNAVMQVESEEYESGIIAQELLKGYTYHDMVVRHSMVAVTI